MTSDQNAPPPPPATAFCRICGKTLETDAQKVAFGTIYCAEHLPAAETNGSPWTTTASSGTVTPPVPPWTVAPTVPPPPPGAVNQSGSPGLAFVLGLLPGVGAIYNAQYAKGLVHVLIFGTLISLANSRSLGEFQPLIGLLIPAWVFYQAFEAYHTARRRQAGEPVDEFSGLVDAPAGQAGLPIGPLVLIGLGTIFLLHNFELVRLADLFKFWPVGLIGLGAYLLYRRMQPAAPAPNGEVRRDQ
jgi:TM2 domain-containing membrane protein YozV